MAAEAVSAGAVAAQSCGGDSSAAPTQACQGEIASARAFRCGPGRELGREHAASAVAEVAEVVAAAAAAAAAAVAEAVAEVAEAAAQGCDGESSTCPMDEIASSRAFGRALGRENASVHPAAIVGVRTTAVRGGAHATATLIVTVSGVGDTARATCLCHARRSGLASGHES